MDELVLGAKTETTCWHCQRASTFGQMFLAGGRCPYCGRGHVGCDLRVMREPELVWLEYENNELEVCVKSGGLKDEVLRQIERIMQKYGFWLSHEYKDFRRYKLTNVSPAKALVIGKELKELLKGKVRKPKKRVKEQYTVVAEVGVLNEDGYAKAGYSLEKSKSKYELIRWASGGDYGEPIAEFKRLDDALAALAERAEGLAEAGDVEVRVAYNYANLRPVREFCERMEGLGYMVDFV